MFRALIQAFTGRAGFMSSLLALSIIVLTAAAILLTLPQIEQKLEDSAQSVLDESLTDKDSLESFSVQGRQLQLQGEFEDAADLSAKLREIKGVRSVLVNGLESESVAVDSQADAAADSVSDTGEQQSTPAQSIDLPETGGVVDSDNESGNIEPKSDDRVEAMVIEDSATEQVTPSEQAPVDDHLMASGELPVQSAAEGEENTSDGVQFFDQSSLVLRYDGKQLSLSGHLADEQMAQLIAERVAYAAPDDSELEIKLDGNGKGSPLNWMREFLDTVSDLPDDAQGRIEGSDKQGVQIVPDLEQTLVVQRDIPVANAEDSLELQGEPALTESSVAILEEAGQDEAVQDVSVQIEAVSGANVDAPDQDTQASESVEREAMQAPVVVPVEFITELNARIAGQTWFEPGEYVIGEALALELDGLAEMMQQHPDLLLKIVGNLDFSVGPRDARYVGIDRAREIRDYLAMQQIQPYRVFATPLPRDSAFDQRIQLVFYISE